MSPDTLSITVYAENIFHSATELFSHKSYLTTVEGNHRNFTRNPQRVRQYQLKRLPGYFVFYFCYENNHGNQKALTFERTHETQCEFLCQKTIPCIIINIFCIQRQSPQQTFFKTCKSKHRIEMDAMCCNRVQM